MFDIYMLMLGSAILGGSAAIIGFVLAGFFE